MKRGKSAKTQDLKSPSRPQTEFPKAKFRAIVKMKKPWTTEFPKKPTLDMVLEALADEIRCAEIDDYFEITVEEVKGDE